MSAFTSGKVTVCFVDTPEDGRARITARFAPSSDIGRYLLALHDRRWFINTEGGVLCEFEDSGSLVVLRLSTKALRAMAKTYVRANDPSAVKVGLVLPNPPLQ